MSVLGPEPRWDRPSGFFAISSLRYFSTLWAHDANSASAAAATTTNLRLGWDLRRGDLAITPFLGAQNWTGTKFDDRIRPNASFGRYYEPAPRATLYGGVELRYAGAAR